MAELNDNRPVKVEVKDLTKRFGDLLRRGSYEL